MDVDDQIDNNYDTNNVYPNVDDKHLALPMVVATSPLAAPSQGMESACYCLLSPALLFRNSSLHNNNINISYYNHIVPIIISIILIAMIIDKRWLSLLSEPARKFRLSSKNKQNACKMEKTGWERVWESLGKNNWVRANVAARVIMVRHHVEPCDYHYLTRNHTDPLRRYSP